MQVTRGLTRERSDTIGFVLACLFSSAIDREELREWSFHVIVELDASSTPSYLFDLGDTDGSPAAIYRLLGFVPSWKHSDLQRLALLGLAITRGRSRVDWPVSASEAMAALRAHPEIQERFRLEFPFISL